MSECTGQYTIITLLAQYNNNACLALPLYMCTCTTQLHITPVDTYTLITSVYPQVHCTNMYIHNYVNSLSQKSHSELYTLFTEKAMRVGHRV